MSAACRCAAAAWTSPCAGWIRFVADQSSGQRRGVAGRVGPAIQRRVDLVEMQGDRSAVRVDEYQFADRQERTRHDVHPPHERCRSRLGTDHHRVVDRKRGRSGRELGRAQSVCLGHDLYRRLRRQGGVDGRRRADVNLREGLSSDGETFLASSMCTISSPPMIGMPWCRCSNRTTDRWLSAVMIRVIVSCAACSCTPNSGPHSER